jgi:hypothetical protein
MPANRLPRICSSRKKRSLLRGSRATVQTKRKSPAQLPIFVRSQVLAIDVANFVQECMSLGFSPLPEASLVVLASRFIDCADKFMMNGGKISLAYHLSEKHDGRMTQICQDGLGPYANVSTNMEAAYTRSESLLRNKAIYSTNLSSIPESHTIKGTFETGHLGWIVATTEDHSTRRSVSTTRVRSGYANVRTLTSSNDSLPLVCFDTSLRNHDMIRRLWKVSLTEPTGLF